MQSEPHFFFKVAQHIFYIGNRPRIHPRLQFNDLALARNHPRNLGLSPSVELKTGDIIKALLDMALQVSHIGGLGENFKEFIVREKVEARESLAFDIEVIF